MSTIARDVPRARTGVKVTKGLVIFHRWIGIALCLFFAMWFVTGVVMMYVPYPFLGDGARIAKGPPIDAAQVTVSPADALAVSGVTSPARVRLLETNGQASYVINPGKGSQVMVSASTGKVVRGVDADAARAIAGAFAKLPVASVSAPMDYDQWMGPPPIRPLSPVLQGLPRRSRRNRPLRVAEVG